MIMTKCDGSSSTTSSFNGGKEDSVQKESAFDYYFPPMDKVPRPTLAHPLLEVKEKGSERVVGGGRGEEDEEKTIPVMVEETAPAVVRKSINKIVGGGGGQVVVGRRGMGMNLMQIFVDLDELFLKASESVQAVS